MRKAYTTPTLVASGNVLASTRTLYKAPSNQDGVPFRKNIAFGDLGFGL